MNSTLNQIKNGWMFILVFFLIVSSAKAQYTKVNGNDVTAPLHLLKPNYDTPYGDTKLEDVKKVLDKVYQYLSAVTPAQMVNSSDNSEITNLSKVDASSKFKQGDFRLISYEWGVTYTGMLEVGLATSDQKYTDYTISRLNFIGDVVKNYKAALQNNVKIETPVKSVLEPKALDDAGSMAAAMIKASSLGANEQNLRPMINHYIDYIMAKEFRLADGTLARNRPLPNTIWLDDLYMSLPALAQIGKLTGEQKYYDEVLKQFNQFSARMFNKEKNLFMHGWVQDMNPHPQFHWARANGWALLTMVEILDVLPLNYPGRAEVLSRFQNHVFGLAERQDKTGFWHQLLDRNDSYLETSATAIYTYCISRGINKGWLDAKAYGPMALLAWNAVATKVNEKGQVEGVCVGTGMGFDPAFYYYRPVNNFAAHGYGPTLLAGAEIYRLLKNHPSEINDSALQMRK
jgi:unsaturated rhamnogalacturonyl hydrolase